MLFDNRARNNSVSKGKPKSHIEENLDVLGFEISQYNIEIFHNLNVHYSAFGSLPYV